MKFATAAEVEEVLWIMRLADLKRSSDRDVLNRLYNGNPPYSQEKAEENNIQVNRNFLGGTNLLTQGRSQWNNAFLKQATYFSATLDSGPVFKRQQWGHTITNHANRALKGCRSQMEQIRAEGGQVLLHGIGPSTFKDRRTPIPTPLLISSLMIPSETDLDFENLEYFSTFHEWTPFQLWSMTHGPKVDPGWNMDAVQAQWKYIRDEIQKGPNSSAYQYMPERISELAKQDGGGFLGSDAVPTVDVWNFYFRESRDGEGWYRRVILDWGVSAQTENSAKPDSKNKSKEMGGFLYSSGKRKFADHLSEILQCQFGDCSSVFPAKLHSVRSLGWMLWGVCELENRLMCKFTEAAFQQCMWFFRTANGNDLARIKEAMLQNVGVIPHGVNFVTANDRFKPDGDIMKQIFGMTNQIKAQSAASFQQGFEEVSNKEMSATETMARVHSVNSMVGGMLSIAYEYAKYKYMEQMRRLCIKHSPYKMAKDFQAACLRDGVPEDMLDASQMCIEPTKALGDGNKMLGMGIVQFLQQIRKNLGPDAKRKVDHISVLVATDQASLAEDLAPVAGQKKLSSSAHDAQLSTDRILKGLPFGEMNKETGALELSSEMVPEDYVQVWLGDMGTLVQQAQQGMQTGQVATMDQVKGLFNLGQHIGALLKGMAHDKEDKEHVKKYADMLGKLMNFVKQLGQQAQEHAGKQGGNGQPSPEDTAKIKTDAMVKAAKLQNMKESHAVRTAQHIAQFETTEQLKDREANAKIRRENARTKQELVHNHLRSLAE